MNASLDNKELIKFADITQHNLPLLAKVDWVYRLEYLEHIVSITSHCLFETDYNPNQNIPYLRLRQLDACAVRTSGSDEEGGSQLEVININRICKLLKKYGF